MSSYIIIPFCNDWNRGDQALVWETERQARRNGFEGVFYAIGKREELYQTRNLGIEPISQIIEHPSRLFKSHDNIKYDYKLKIKWGIVSVFDLISTLLYITPGIKHIARLFVSSEKKRSMNLIAKSDAVFVKGGGFIHSYGGLHGTYTVYYSLYHIIYALAEKKDVYIMPNSYGPFDGPLVKWMVKKVLGKCKLVSARETISRDMLHSQCGVESKLLPDLAMGFQGRKSERADGLIKDIPFGDKKCVAITVRPYRFPGAEDGAAAYENYKDSFAKFVSYLYDEGFYPVMVEHVYSEQEHENDGTAINDIIKKLPDGIYSVIGDRELDCEELKYIYSKFDYIVGTRFHSVLFSITSGAIPVAISYGGNKGDGIMRDMGISELCIPINQVNFESLKDRFDKMLSKQEEYRDKINKYTEKSKNELLRMWE